jgi:hypothetical protein
MKSVVAATGIAVLAAIAVTATSKASFAQAGSTGGTIGKQDKSISGGQETHSLRRDTRPDKPAPVSSSPQIIHLSEHNATYGEFTATLKLTGSNTYEARYNQGTISRMTVTIGQDSMTIERRDLSGVFPCHGHYNGTRMPGTSKASGESTVACGLVGTTSTWDASW